MNDRSYRYSTCGLPSDRPQTSCLLHSYKCNEMSVGTMTGDPYGHPDRRSASVSRQRRPPRSVREHQREGPIIRNLRLVIINAPDSTARWRWVEGTRISPHSRSRPPEGVRRPVGRRCNRGRRHERPRVRRGRPDQGCRPRQARRPRTPSPPRADPGASRSIRPFARGSHRRPPGGSRLGPVSGMYEHPSV